MASALDFDFAGVDVDSSSSSSSSFYYRENQSSRDSGNIPGDAETTQEKNRLYSTWYWDPSQCFFVRNFTLPVGKGHIINTDSRRQRSRATHSPRKKQETGIIGGVAFVVLHTNSSDNKGLSVCQSKRVTTPLAHSQRGRPRTPIHTGCRSSSCITDLQPTIAPLNDLSLTYSTIEEPIKEERETKRHRSLYPAPPALKLKSKHSKTCIVSL
jgi:hypothetical protein